ncbi:MAG: DMT family transporter [Pseudomonadota bacterium]
MPDVAAGPRHDLRRGVIYAVLTTMVGSTAAAAAKFLGDRVSPYVIVFAQYLVGVLVLLPWLLRRGPRALATGRFALHFWRSIAGWVGFMAYYVALVHVPLVDASLLRSAAPIWVPLVLFCWLGVRLPPVRWLAIGIGFAGVLLILHPDAQGISVWHLVGSLAGIGLGISMATTRRLAASESPQAIIFYYFGIAAVATLPFAIAAWQPVSLVDTLVLAFIGLSIYVTMALYTAAYTWAKSSVISPLSFLGVVFAGLFGFLFWNEVPSWLTVAGILLVIGGGVYAVWLESRSTTQEE